MKKYSTTLALALVLVGCSHATTSSKTSNASDASRSAASVNDSSDPRLWLEDVNSPKALDQVKKWNDPTLAELQNDSRYKRIEHSARKIMLAEDRIPYGSLYGNYIYNFWQDKKNVRGLWRRTTLAEYAKKSSKWETVLDLDKLSADEKENWVWKGASCLLPDYELCMVSLSRGGKDATVLREFEVSKKSFAMGGFALPEAKSSTSWVDKDTLLVATDTGAGSTTTSGYARQIRKWPRGTPLMDAPIIFSAQESDVSASMFVSIAPAGTFQILTREKTFFTSENHLLKDNGQILDIPLPDSFSVMALNQGWLIGKVRQNWTTGGRTFKTGSVLALSLKDLPNVTQPELIFEPDARSSVESILVTRSHMYLQINVNVIGRIVRVDLTKNAKGSPKWTFEKVPMREDGDVSLISGNPFSDLTLVGYAGFLVPDTVYLLEPKGRNSVLKTLRSLPARFDASHLTVEQFETPSRDGVRIPYFIVHSKDIKMNSLNPTLLYGYGGFEISETPSYLGSIGKAWSEKGGVYVLANIRGGGEFGPDWHEAARLKNRQRAYDDFISVAEDLIRRKITSPKHLGIMGGSNGGLLVGAVFVQRPELFNAVVCQVPLLDMLRYHKLLAGASWMGEYGNPDDPEMAAVIRKYSPYQNLKAGVKYPRVFFMTSTRDDRVHPGHARKMAAKMEELGDPFLYFENTEGGHGAAANLEQRIRFFALEWTYLWKQLNWQDVK